MLVFEHLNFCFHISLVNRQQPCNYGEARISIATEQVLFQAMMGSEEFLRASESMTRHWHDTDQGLQLILIPWFVWTIRGNMCLRHIWCRISWNVAPIMHIDVIFWHQYLGLAWIKFSIHVIPKNYGILGLMWNPPNMQEASLNLLGAVDRTHLVSFEVSWIHYNYTKIVPVFILIETKWVLIMVLSLILLIVFLMLTSEWCGIIYI